jgi:SAM-dependent methyltransferase
MSLAVAKRLHHVTFQAPRTERLAPALARLAQGGRRVLDVGSGTGELARRVGELLGAEHVEGVDVLVQPAPEVPVTRYDGARLPFATGAFDVVLLSDVLHHAREPHALFAEALRVAAHAVVVKDHFAFGPVSRAMLLAMDLGANGFYGIGVLGNYFDPTAWHEMVRGAGGAVRELVWPLHVHAAPMRWITRSELQFAARVERAS